MNRMKRVSILMAFVAAMMGILPGTSLAHNDSRPSLNGASPWHYTESYRMTNWYGEGNHVDYHSSFGHLNDYYALDFGMPCGRRLYPVWNDMKVTGVSGDVITMEKTINGERYRLRYRHLSQILVSPGATVHSWTIIGYSGDRNLNGGSGCHLHMSVHRFNSNGWWYSIPPMFCGRTYPHDHYTYWRGC